MPLNISGHYWTIAPSLRHQFFPLEEPPHGPFSTRVSDGPAGELELTGLIRDVADSDECLLVVHGLGGSAHAYYCVLAAWAAERAGISCLRVCLRGADRQGGDFYHAGLRSDLDAAVASAALARYSRIYVLGYSLGGHVVLCYALSPNDPRVRGVAAVGAPLDLDLAAYEIDRPRAVIYRQHILTGLKEIYEEVAEHRPVPTPIERIRDVSHLREWDALTVVPRFGFDDVDHYYASQSVGPKLSQISVSSLLVQSDYDPMVPAATYAHHLPGASSKLSVVSLESGGHVGFPSRVQLSQDTQPGPLEPQIIGWLRAR